MQHQYIERQTGEIRNEHLFADRWIRLLYSDVREHVPRVFSALTGPHGSSLLGYLNFETRLGARLGSARTVLGHWGIDPAECLDDPGTLDTPAKIFMRRIRYWECRPLPAGPATVVAPADSRVLLGSLAETALLFIKNKFFEYDELLGLDRPHWAAAFAGGDFAVFRLTPEKYHYNHLPVTGRVVDLYEIAGGYHSCNPSAVVQLVTPHSKNHRVVTVLDTDVPGGTGVGYVAMIEVAALMVGEIVQRYSARRYDDPRPLQEGDLLQRGQPKSLFRPGSSTVVLLFAPDRIRFDDDLLGNQRATGPRSRFSQGFGRPLVETDIPVRSRLGVAVEH